MFKYKKKSIIALLIAEILCVSGCGSSQSSTAQTESSESAEYSLEEMFSDRDFEIGYDEAGSTVINLESTVTISEEGTYILKGSLSDGMVIVEADKSDKIQIVLDNVDISSSTSAAIYVKQADKVFITLAADSENILSNGGEFVAIDDNNIDAVIFSKDDITINGNGSLTIKSPAGHGIVSKDDLKITSGEYTIDSMKDGLSGKDSVKIANGTINISSKGDGISSEGIVYIEDGVFDIITGGGSENAKMKTGMDDMMNRPGGMRGGKNENMSEGDNRMPAGELANPKELNTDYSVSDDEASDTTSTKGIKAEELLMINGGTFNLDCVDDGIHSNTDVMINGGSFTIKTGDDGIHGENELTVSGGSIDISKCYEGLEADNLTIANGNISVVSNDDGINAASAINIKGGTIDVTSTGDCIDSNGDCFVSGGTITLSKINFVELINQTAGEFDEKFATKGLTLITNLPEENVYIMADGMRIWRVIENLYNNVAKYAMPNTRVYAGITVIEDMAEFSIKNISQQPLNIEANELTERFIMGDVSRSSEGSGLGLSIAKDLTRLQGGTFEIYLDGDLFKAMVRFKIA